MSGTAAPPTLIAASCKTTAKSAGATIHRAPNNKERTTNKELRLALEALERGAREAREASLRSAHELRDRLERTAGEILTHLEAASEEPEPEDLVSRLDRQAKDIAEDLRRVERLMKDRLSDR